MTRNGKSSGNGKAVGGGKKWNGKAGGYEHGEFFRGEGYSFLSDEIATREFTHGLISSEVLLLVAITRHVWKEKNLIVRLSNSFLRLNTQLTKRTLERQLAPKSRLRRQGFIRLERKDHDEGNEYFIEPVFIWSSKWHLLDNIENSLVVQSRAPRYDDRGELVRSDIFSRHEPPRQPTIPGVTRPLTKQERERIAAELRAQGALTSDTPIL